MQAYLRAQQITSAPAKPAREILVKSGANEGKVLKLKAKPARKGMLPVSEKTLWTWAKLGKFPKPIKMNGATVWRAADVVAWIAEQEATA